MTTTKIQFLVQMTCDSCVNAVKKCLENVDGIESVDIDLAQNSVVVESTLHTLDIQKRLELTGRPFTIKGYEGSSAAVAILEAGNEKVKGVVRFVQATPNTCVVDGTIDGLRPGDHKIQIHDYGDLSNECACVGSLFIPSGYSGNREYGKLGIITAEKNGRAAFRMEDKVLKVSDVIGRSFVVSSQVG